MKKALVFAYITILATQSMVLLGTNSTPIQQEQRNSNVQNSSGPDSFSWTTMAAAGIGISFVGFQGGRFVIRSALSLTKALMRRPLVATALGSLVIAPLLEETLFAAEPNMNPRDITHKIRARWATQRVHAAKNIEDFDAQLRRKYTGTVENIKTNHPEAYTWFEKIGAQPVAQDAKYFSIWCKNNAKLTLAALKEWADDEPQPCKEEKPKKYQDY